MHICYLCDEYPPGPHGGIGALTQTIGRAMVRLGHRVTVIGLYRVARVQVEDDQGVQVIRVPHTQIPWTGIVVNSVRLRRELRRIHLESPISVLEGPELSLAMLPRGLPIPKVIRINGGHHFFAVTLGKKPRAWRSLIERISFSRADHLCAVSEFAARVTRELLHLGDRPIEVLPNPVDVTLFRPPVRPPEPGMIVFAGTLCEKKGLRQLVHAFAAVLRAAPHARLVLVGRDTRDPVTGGGYADMLRGRLGPEEARRVEFTGHLARHDVADMFARAEIGVFPSHMETQGIVVAEAMATGLAVVSSETGPGPEIVEDGVSGLLCNPHDAASISDRLIALLGDAELRSRLGRAARSRAVERFSEAALLGRTEAFYARCADDSVPAHAAGLFA